MQQIKQETHTGPLSFLQVSRFGSDMVEKLSNIENPKVDVEIVDVFEPDPDIEPKIEEVEDKRADEENETFEQAMEEFSQITSITVKELAKNLQTELNAFLVDRTGIENVLKEQMENFPLPNSNSEEIGSPRLIQINPKNETELISANVVKQNYPRKDFLPEGPLSFLAIGDSSVEAEQLNVRFGVGDKPYPSVDSLVGDMEERRDITERLARSKILELELKLMKAQNEMIKDSLHGAISKVLASLGEASSSLKEAFVQKELK
eukprot:GHVP01056706.1.p2 GENE.GHVP01056706.1~~GHVP01056706.1.p2  ORF type:complete len:263 (+),score=67.04 GHVP01056706.1:224-1012(+)